MANTIFRALLHEQIDVFRAAFSTTSTEVFYDQDLRRLRHSGEYGTFREAIVRDFLRFIVPRSLDTASGFVMTAQNSVSTQCDVVVFDSRTTPLYVEGDRQRFFPIECVFGIGEVKSTLSKSNLAEALNKLAAVKKLSDEISSPSLIGKQEPYIFDPVTNPYDLVPSFLICQRFNFDHSKLETELDELYDQCVEHRHKHNFVLSIEDGILCYSSSGGHLPYPKLGVQDMKHRFVLPNGDKYAHFKAFASFMFQVTSGKSRLYPELSDYIGTLANATYRTQP